MKIELILAKSACFTTPVNIQEMTICPLHRERLGIGWRKSIIQCSVPEELSGHDDTAKATSSYFSEGNSVSFPKRCSV